MKKQLFIVCFLFCCSCTESNRKRSENAVVADSYQPTTTVLTDTIKEDIGAMEDALPLSIHEFIGDTLIGMELNEEETSRDPYIRYGLDFSSACYEGNLGVFIITKDQIILKDYWGTEPEQATEIKEVISRPKELKLKGNKLEFIITKIEEAPVYLLKVNGALVTDLKLGKYYTKASTLKKFYAHDCGDFDG